MTQEGKEQACDAFIALVRHEGARLYRELPWRENDDPFIVLTSEIMLQQTQVARVLGYWNRWLAAFPTVDALAAASMTDVLERWQGLGYHRRALAFKRTAELCAEHYRGQVPRAYHDLLALPGVGPATAAGVCVFAYGEPRVYLETNVRAVFLHHFFEGRDQVPDRELIPHIEASCDRDNPRSWYYALLDYGNHLKSILPNPSRRSRHHTRQSPFEGSARQKRAELLRLVMAEPHLSTDELTARLNDIERTAGRTSTGGD
ncbi:MAG: adenine glycosylase, partial [Coriobacteriales bacterium]|nr:adenine glycosylase [Coriobacteriales bacterium]